MQSWFQDNAPVIVTLSVGALFALACIIIEESFSPFFRFRGAVRRARWFLRIPLWALSMAVIVGIHAFVQLVTFMFFGLEFSFIPIFVVFLSGVTFALALLLPEEDPYGLYTQSAGEAEADFLVDEPPHEESELEENNEH